MSYVHNKRRKGGSSRAQADERAEQALKPSPLFLRNAHLPSEHPLLCPAALMTGLPKAPQGSIGIPRVCGAT